MCLGITQRSETIIILLAGSVPQAYKNKDKGENKDKDKDKTRNNVKGWTNNMGTKKNTNNV